MSHLNIYLLGAPRAECDGAPLVTDTRKAIALLAYLSVTGRTFTRDAIAALLWPDLDQTRARSALRRTLSSIHAACDATWLITDRESVGLARDGTVWCDAVAFSEAVAERTRHGHAPEVTCDLCGPLLERAIKLYHDDFMAGFSLRDSVSFDDWQFFQAEGFRRDFADVLERDVQAHILRHEWQAAIARARRWLALDPLHEPAHRQLMLLYAWAGERAAALRQFQVCTDVLQRELDVTPLPETLALYQLIREQREPSPPEAPVAPAPFAISSAAAAVAAVAPAEAGARATPLIGRAAELEQLRAIHLAARSSGRLVILEGEAGIGKTRLAEAFCASLPAGTLAVTARCYEGEQDLAYAPFIQALRAAMVLPHAARALARLEPHWRAELRRLLPEIDSAQPEPAADPADATGAKARLFESVAHVLHALLHGAGGQAGVLLVDDLQWADSASLDLFGYLVHRLATYPLLLIVTQRSDEPSHEERLRALLADAQRRRIADILTLPRLDAVAVRELVATVRPALPEAAASSMQALADKLYREAEGLPFFVVEYLEALVTEDVLPDAEWPQPESIRDLLRSRLAHVGEAGRQLLATAAVVGRSFGFDALRAASGRSDDETIVAVEELLERGMIREVSGGSYDFSHEQLRAVVYDDISLTRRRLLHRRVAETLQTQARLAGKDGTEIAAVLGHHFEQAGQPADAARWYYAAGERASELYANRDALSHLLKAAALGYPDTAALHLRLGNVRSLLGDLAQAAADYEQALEAAQSDRQPAVRHQLGRVLHSLGDYERAADEYQHALDQLPATSEAMALRSQILADAGLTAYRRGNPDDAVALMRLALIQAETADDQPALTRAHTMLSHLARYGRDYPEALAQARQAVMIAEERRDPALLTAALNAIALAYAAAGDPGRALPFLQRALELCIKQGDRHREAALHNNLADVYHLCNDAAAAMEHLKHAVTIFAEIGGGIGAENPEIWKLTEW